MTQDQLKLLIHYDPLSGVFTWLKRENTRWNTQWAGKVAGSKQKKGYWQLKIYSKAYKAHRLAFLYMIGCLPNNDVDHVNGIKTDNRWENLRDVTNTTNTRNQKKRTINVSGYTGVSKVSSKWRSTIMVDGTNTHLGYFECPYEAFKARQFFIQNNPQLGFTGRHGI